MQGRSAGRLHAVRGVTCFSTSEFERGCVGELSDRGDWGFCGDSGGCKYKS